MIRQKFDRWELDNQRTYAMISKIVVKNLVYKCKKEHPYSKLDVLFLFAFYVSDFMSHDLRSRAFYLEFLQT